MDKICNEKSKKKVYDGLKYLQVTESEMVKTILKVQILSDKPSNSMGKNVPLQKDEVFIDLKCTECAKGRKI